MLVIRYWSRSLHLAQVARYDTTPSIPSESKYIEGFSQWSKFLIFVKTTKYLRFQSMYFQVSPFACSQGETSYITEGKQTHDREKLWCAVQKQDGKWELKEYIFPCLYFTCGICYYLWNYVPVGFRSRPTALRWFFWNVFDFLQMFLTFNVSLILVKVCWLYFTNFTWVRENFLFPWSHVPYQSGTPKRTTLETQ